MKILHFILGKANPNRANGVNQVIYGLAKYQSLQGHQVYVVGISKSMSTPFEEVDRGYFKVEAFKSFDMGGLQRIKELATNVDIVHLHGVWSMLNVKVGKYLKSINKPYIITAHCGYAIDRLKQSNYWAKLTYHYFWQKHLYEHSAGIHALTREESTDIAKFCKHNNIFVVNNGVDSEVYDKYQYQLHHREKIRFGYLGRLSVEKNINNLILAYNALPKRYKDRTELYLIGPLDDKSKLFEAIVNQKGLSNNIRFIGGKYGDDKIKELLDLDIYIHPAYSDVVGISVMEAIALGIPCIVTRTSHVSYFYQSKAFIMVEPTYFDLCRGMQEAIERKKEWSEISINAKHLYNDVFNWNTAVKNIIEQYKKVAF